MTWKVIDHFEFTHGHIEDGVSTSFDGNIHGIEPVHLACSDEFTDGHSDAGGRPNVTDAPDDLVVNVFVQRCEMRDDQEELFKTCGNLPPMTTTGPTTTTTEAETTTAGSADPQEARPALTG